MYKNYEFNIFKIKKENFNLNEKFNNSYIKNFIKDPENIIYKYECYYNKNYKKMFYYNEKRKKYNNYYYSLKFKKNIENELKKDILKNSSIFSLNKKNIIHYIEIYIKNNFNFLKKYNVLKYENEIFIIEKKLFK